MKKGHLKILSAFLSVLIVVVLIVNYFSRQDVSTDSAREERRNRKDLAPFRWNMDNPDEIDSYSESVEDYYFKEGKLFLYYKKSMFISPQQKGRLIDIERFPNFTMTLFSKRTVILIVRFWAHSESGKPLGLVSENLLIHKGWNRISVNFRDLMFFEKIQDMKNRFDLLQSRIMVKQIRFDFVNNDNDDNYMFFDFIRLNQQGRLNLTPTDFYIWGDGRNFIENGNRLKQRDSKIPMEISMGPFGFDSSVRKLSVIVDTNGKNDQLSLYYRLYDMAEDPLVPDPDARSWKMIPMDDGKAEINTEGASMAELRLFIPVASAGKSIAIENVKLFMERDFNSEQYYPLQGLITAPYAAGSRMETEIIKFPREGYWITDLEYDPVCFQNVNLALAKGYSIVGRMDGSFDKNKAEKTIRLYKDMIGIWLIKQKDGHERHEFLKELIERFEPDAHILEPGSDGDSLYKENKKDLQQKLGRLPHSFVKMDRGPVFFTGAVLITLLLLIFIRNKLEIGFAFKPEHLKWFGLCLIGSVAILVPLVFLLGLGKYRYIEIKEILSAVYRYGISAFLQELMRAVAIEYTVELALKKIKSIDKKYLTALLITSVFFSLGHLGYPGLDAGRELSFLLVTFFAGLIFGFLYIRTRSVLPVTVLHFVANLFLFVFTTM